MTIHPKLQTETNKQGQSPQILNVNLGKELIMDAYHDPKLRDIKQRMQEEFATSQ